MKIYLFKLIYPSGYTRYGLTLNEAIRFMSKRDDLEFKNDGVKHL